MESATIQYLKGTVGEALARGCAATVQEHPADPVEFLALWLNRYVANIQTLEEYQKDKEDNAKLLTEKDKEEAAARAAEEARVAVRTEELEGLRGSTQDVWALWQAAVDLCIKNTSATAVYVANVSAEDAAEPPVPEGEEAPQEPADGEEEAPEDPDKPYDEPEPAPEGEAGAVEGKPEGDGEDEEGEEEEEAPAAPPPVVHDYSKAFFEYVVHSEGQDWIKETPKLGRPEPAEDAPEDAPPPKVPVLFRVLDDKLQSLYFPDVLLQNSVSFFRGFPRVGAFLARALLGRHRECRAVLCADTVMPDRPADNGRELPAADRDYVAAVAEAVEAAMEAIATEAEAAAAERRSYPLRVALQVATREAGAPPPSAEDESPAPAPEPKKDEGKGKGGKKEEPSAAKEAKVVKEAPKKVEAPPAEEEGEGEGGEVEDDLDIDLETEMPDKPEVPEEEPEPEYDAGPGEGEEEEARAEREAGNKAKRAEWLGRCAERAAAVAAAAEWAVDAARRERKAAFEAIKTARQALEEAGAAAEVQCRQFTVVKSAVAGVAPQAMVDLRTLTRSPATTFQVLRAAVRIIGRGELAESWTAFLQGFSKAILDAFSNYDPESFASVPPETVRRVAANVAGLNTEDMVKVFEKECPRTSVGSFLLRWIYHCKKAGLSLMAKHAAEKVLADAEERKRVADEAVAAAREAHERAVAAVAEAEAATREGEGEAEGAAE